MNIESIAKLSKAEAVKLAASEDQKAQRAFIIVSKILFSLEASMKSGDSPVGTQLVKAGVRKSTVDNARYAAKALALVKSGELTEEKFDSLSHSHFVLLETVIKPKGKEILSEVLTAKDVRKAIEKHQPEEKKKAAKKKAPAATPPVGGSEAEAPVTENEETAPVVASVPSEKDLLDIAALLSEGIHARLAAEQDVSAVYTDLVNLVNALAEVVAPAPLKKAA